MITGNNFVVNYACFSGGGAITCYYSSPIIMDNTIMNNESDDGSGGIYLYESSPIIRNNVITNNMAYSGNGGIRCDHESSPIIENNTFSENQGAAISCLSGSSPTIKENTITENDCGISTNSSFPTIVDNIIADNTESGIQCNSYSSLIKGNMILGNSGGGIRCELSHTHIMNNTIVGNTANMGGGINCSYSSFVTITNTILWGNNAAIGEEIYIGEAPNDHSTLTIDHSDIEGGLTSVFVAPGCTLNWGDGMIDLDPAIVLPDKADYRLLWESPCIDTGHPDHLDPDGTRSDMGAHYFNQNDYLTLYVTPDITEVTPGDQLGVTYTAINRWDNTELFWVLSRVLRPGGFSLNVLGPEQYILPANHTAQVHISHSVPNEIPAGVYEYLSAMGMPPSTLYDWDSFKFWVYD